LNAHVSHLCLLFFIGQANWFRIAFMDCPGSSDPGLQFLSKTSELTRRGRSEPVLKCGKPYFVLASPECHTFPARTIG
jgi:hypothetical protein